MNNDLLFAPDEDDEIIPDKLNTLPPWPILIVDDDVEIHFMSQLLFKGFEYAGRKLELISAYTGKEALEVMQNRNDIAVILLDVVMETDDAGLRFVRALRDELNNKATRIILRTGQPGQAPEREIILTYDINDYKAKTELTSQKLFTAVVTALRGYQQIGELENHRHNLKEMVAERTREAEEKSCLLEATLSSMSDGLAVFDLNQKIMLANPKAYTLLNTNDPIQLYFKDQQEIQFTNGNVIRIKTTDFPGGGQINLYSDVSEDRRREAELIKAKKQAERADKAKSMFLAAMTHEIRTPMNGVQGMLELLRHTKLLPEQVEIIDVIQESAVSLLNIVNDILDFSKIEAGKMELEQTQFELTKTIEGVAEVLAPSAQKKGVALFAYIDPLIPRKPLGDPTRIRQILFNLLGNALKFTEKGEVSLKAKLLEASGNRVRIRLEIKDSGIGISDIVKEKHFAPYSQAAADITRKFGGTGLGLAICRRLVDMMNGKIGVESEEGKGSIFWVELELPFEEEALKAELPLAEIKAGIILESATEKEIVTNYLTAAGGSLVSPANAQILIVGEEVKTDLSQYSQPILLLHSRGASKDRPGISAFTTRPLRITPFIEAVRTALNKPQAAKAEQSHVSHSISGKGQKILIAEDNPVNRTVIERQLNLMGFKPETCENGAEALAAWQKASYDLLLTDCNMPTMDGFELCQRIREEEQVTGRKKIPILAFTAVESEDEINKCKEAGMDDFVSKPVSMKQLEAKLSHWLIKIPIDTTYLSSMFGGDSATVAKLLRDFLENCQSLTRELKTAINEKEAKGVASAAHQIKGTAMLVGAKDLATIGRNLEEEGRLENWSEIANLWIALEDTINEISEYINNS